jgi:hypothetical protein
VLIKLLESNCECDVRARNVILPTKLLISNKASKNYLLTTKVTPAARRNKLLRVFLSSSTLSLTFT